MGTRPKHQFTLSVGIVDLTREEGGQLVRSAYRLVEEALPIASAKKKKKNSKNVCTVNNKKNINRQMHTYRRQTLRTFSG